MADSNDEQKLAQKSKQILRQKIPDDAKILFYGDAARDLNVKQVRKREMPIIVKDEDTPPRVMSEDRMIAHINNPKGVAIHQYLKTHGITYNANNEVVVNGQAISGSLYPLMIRGIMDYRVGYQPGIQEVMQALPTASPSFSKAIVAKYMPQSSPSKSGARSSVRSAKRSQKGSGYMWKQLY